MYYCIISEFVQQMELQHFNLTFHWIIPENQDWVLGGKKVLLST